MYYIRVVQAKLLDFKDVEKNSIGLHRHFFRLFLKYWRKRNLPNNIEKELSIEEFVEEILFYSIKLQTHQLFYPMEIYE